MSEPPENNKDDVEETREIWSKLTRDTVPSTEPEEEPAIIEEEPAIIEELPSDEDRIEGPLPENLEDIEERSKKIEAALRAEAARKAEEARRTERLRMEEEAQKRNEEEDRIHAEGEARRRLEETERQRAEEEVRRRREEAERQRAEEEARRRREEAERQRAEEEARRRQEEAAPIPESENLLLLGLVNLIQPALDIKLESKKYQRWIKGWDKVIEVNIRDEGQVHVLIKDNQMKAYLGKAPREPDIVLEGEYETITNYLNNELDPILMFFDLVLLRKMTIIKGLEIKLANFLSGNILRQVRDLYKMDKILKIS